MNFIRLLLIIFSITVQAQTVQFPLAGDTASGWNMGGSVDIEGDVAVVGLPSGLGNTTFSGFVYVYEFNGSQWELVSKLTSDLINKRDLFGSKVKISQGRIIVSAHAGERVVDGVPVEQSGLVLIYEKIDGQWVETDELVPSIVEEFDRFGFQIAASNNRIFVSKIDTDSVVGESSGGVFVFEHINDEWIETDFITEEQVLGSSNTLGLWEIDISGDTLVVPNVYAESGVNIAEINVYRLINNIWQLEQKINSPVALNEFFGSTASIKGNRLLLGSSGENSGFGAAYLYERNGSDWTLVKKFLPNNSDQASNFGLGVAMGVDQLVIGSRHELYDGERNDEGQAFIYNSVAGNWLLEDVLEATGDQGHNDFGQELSLDYDRLIVGAPFGNQLSGAAYVFSITPNSERLSINAGLNGAWYNPDTSGQGFFLDVHGPTDFSFLGWFTYDTEASIDDNMGQIGAEGQRWLVGAGNIDQTTSSITYNMYYAYDGLFDDPREVLVSSTETYGSLTLEFQNCTTALVTYHLFDQDISNNFSISRPVAESDTLCSQLVSESTAKISSNDLFNSSLNGAWFNPETPGQGLFIDKFEGTNTAFMGWFTFDSAMPLTSGSSSIGALGQRWLVGAGSVNENDASVLDYQLYYTYGGLFDDPLDVTVVDPGTYGDLRIEFTDCTHANVEYNIDSENLSGAFTMIRPVHDGASCAASTD